MSVNVNGTFNFGDPNWRPFSQEKLDALHVSPNTLFFNTATRAGALVVRKSGRFAEYAVSKAGVDYLNAAKQAQKITEGEVVLSQWDKTKMAVVSQKPVDEVVAELDGIPPRDGPYGPYWWLNADLTINGGRPLNDDAPF
jgi:hypothetical protein